MPSSDSFKGTRRLRDMLVFRPEPVKLAYHPDDGVQGSFLAPVTAEELRDAGIQYLEEGGEVSMPEAFGIGQDEYEHDGSESVSPRPIPGTLAHELELTDRQLDRHRHRVEFCAASREIVLRLTEVRERILIKMLAI